jgi:hypothetical protein
MQYTNSIIKVILIVVSIMILSGCVTFGEELSDELNWIYIWSTM